MKNRKAAKILIKRAKKRPDLYTAQEVLYAKLIRNLHERKIDNSDTQRRGDDGLCGTSEQPEQPRQSKSSWFARLLHKTSTLVGFEQAHMTLEIETTRGIAAQILRHRSFTYQEFSQRYANTNMLGSIDVPDLRSQDHKNRQNSIDDIPQEQKARLQGQIQRYFSEGIDLYNELIREGIAKECARFVLP